jgi:hypothetical protein
MNWRDNYLCALSVLGRIPGCDICTHMDMRYHTDFRNGVWGIFFWRVSRLCKKS